LTRCSRSERELGAGRARALERIDKLATSKMKWQKRLRIG
jgi:hypothetical protein